MLTKRRTKKEEVRRNLTIEFSEEALELMESLRHRLGKKSKSETLKTALLLIDFVQKQREAGYKLALTKGDEVKLVELFL